MAKNKIKRVYLSADEINKEFFKLKADDSELSGFDLLANLITHDVVIEYNDQVKDTRQFRAVEVSKARIGFPKSGEGRGLILADLEVLVEDIFGRIDNIEATGVFAIFRIGNIMMAELDSDEIYFGAHLDDDDLEEVEEYEEE